MDDTTTSMAGRVAVVTGAASGFGRAVVLRLARRGARLVAADVDVDGGEETARLAREAGAEARFARTDVREAGEVGAMVRLAVDAFGRLDMAFNNAGVLGPVGDLHECPASDYERIIAVNVTGVWHCLQAEIVQMLDQTPPAGGHAIVNTASVAGLVASPMLSAYCASKHAVVGLTASAARGYGRRGIRVNCVCPGPVETPLAADLFAAPGARERLLARQAVDRFAEPDEIAATVEWLLSPASSFVTGTPVRVDGGALA